MKHFLTLREVAEYLSVDPKTVYRLIQSGQLPAAKVGGVYRIKVGDVDEFFERRKLRNGEERAAHTTLGKEADMALEEMSEFTPGSCGHCRRIIRNRLMVGGACQEPGCTEILCTACWQHEQGRYCILHTPTSEAKLARARALLERGEIPLLVTAEEARQRELVFISRFDQRIRQESRIISPVDWSPLEVPSWDAVHVEGTGLNAEKHPGILPSGPPQLPRNARSRYNLGASRGTKVGRRAAGFVIMAQAFSHLRAYGQDGFDTQPVTRAELLSALEEAIETAKTTDRFHIAGIGSPTGWEPEAEMMILGDSHSKSFSSLYLSLCLVDLERDRLIFNSLDRRLRPFAQLFRGELSDETIGRTEAFVRERLTSRESQSAQEVAQATGVEPTLVGEAFARLEMTGKYILDHLEGIGLVISRRT